MSPCARLDKKDLEILLEKCEAYRRPKIELEQYVTPSSIAAEVIWLAYLKGDVEGKVVYDLGCGTGRLAIGCALMGAGEVRGFDVDPEALEIARENSERFSVDIKWVEADVKNIKGACDTVIQNPPFGVRRKEADREFLDKALELGKVVYSMHKTETRGFITGYVAKRGRLTDLADVKFQLPYSYDFHRKPVRSINVDVIRIEKVK